MVCEKRYGKSLVSFAAASREWIQPRGAFNNITRKRFSMFSVREKRIISDAVQNLLRETNHPELPLIGEIQFTLHVYGESSWSWADIRNNGAVPSPSVNPHNERQDPEVA